MEKNMQTLLKVLLIVAGPLYYSHAQVPELNEKFLDVYKKGKWLVEFYAPWCGHCKKLEPIYNQVYHQLRNTDVNVAKIDATRFSVVASQFEVRGFPSIKFIHGEKIFVFRGERTKNDILEFVSKAKGPAVRHLSSVGKLNEARSQHSDTVFFLFVGDEDPNNDLFNKYSTVADEQMAITYFYAGTKSILPQDYTLKSYPTILVFKDRTNFEFEAPKGIASMSSVQKWISSERYPAFPMANGPNINEMADTGKFLVIFVIDGKNKDKKIRSMNDRVKEMARFMAVNERQKYHSDFQFLWMDDPETVNSIILSFITMPYVLVLDPTVHLFYIPEKNIADLDANEFGMFLENVKAGKEPAMGGTGFFQRIKRLLYDILVTVIDVWESSRWLFLIMFGLPTGVISIVCYSICCMEGVDEDEIHSDEESDEEYAQIIEEQQRLQQQLKEGGGGGDKADPPTDVPKDPSHPKAE